MGIFVCFPLFLLPIRITQMLHYILKIFFLFFLNFWGRSKEFWLWAKNMKISTCRNQMDLMVEKVLTAACNLKVRILLSNSLSTKTFNLWIKMFDVERNRCGYINHKNNICYFEKDFRLIKVKMFKIIHWCQICIRIFSYQTDRKVLIDGFFLLPT